MLSKLNLPGRRELRQFATGHLHWKVVG